MIEYKEKGKELSDEERAVRSKAHAQLCKDRGVPDFTSRRGDCFSCYRNVWDLEDGTKHVTGCPWCNRSFV